MEFQFLCLVLDLIIRFYTEVPTLLQWQTLL